MKRTLALLALSSMVVLVLSTPAAQASTPTPAAASLGAALADDGVVVDSATYDVGPPNVSFNSSSGLATDAPLAGFPRAGSSYSILSTGAAYSLIGGADTVGGENVGVNNVASHGPKNFDATVLKLTVEVPAGANCLATDLRFLTDEDPTSVSVADGFVMELDSTAWTANATTPLVSAPGAVALVASDGTGGAALGASPTPLRDHATQLLTASTPVSPGMHTLYFSVFDHGDHSTNSDVLLDNLRTSTATNAATQCVKGLAPAITNVVAPVVSGPARVGSTLSASTGTWTPAGLTYSYQWLRDGQPVAGATAASYAVPASDVGGHLSVRVTAANGSSVSAASNATDAVSLGVITAGKVTVKGKAVVGHKLTAKAGTWAPGGVTLAYQWFRGARPIKHAKGTTYKPTRKDKGKKLHVVVTGTRAGYRALTAASASTKKVTEP